MIEQRALSGLTEKLVSAEAVAEAVRGYHEELNRQKRERRGRNPQTGEEMVIRSRSSVVFRPSKLFVPAVNAGVND